MNCRGSNPITKIGQLFALIFFTAAFGFLGATQYQVGIGEDYPFNSIQDAIDTAAHGDTIYVHPGIYTGSLFIGNKQLYLSSLFSITNDPADIDNTVLSGNYGIFEIRYEGSYGPGSLVGFTIRDARNYDRPVLSLRNYTLLSVEHCIITNNRKTHNSSNISIGYGSVVTMKGSKIHNNYSISTAGIWKNINATLIFDRDVKNSIYNNFGSYASDINYQYSSDFNTVPLDTLYLAVASSGMADILFYRGINNVVADSVVGHTVTHDIHVAPWGDDSSDGLSPLNPMRTVHRAARKAFPAEGQTQTIHVAPGTYAFNDFDDLYIGLRPNVGIVGDPDDPPVFDAQGTMFIISKHGGGDFNVENLTLKNSSVYAISNYHTMPVGGYYTNGTLVFKNLRFMDNFLDSQPHFFENAYLSGVISTCSPGFNSSRSFNFACRNVTIENSVFAFRSDTSGYNNSGGVSFSRSTQTFPGEFTANIVNTIFHGIYTYSDFFQGLGMAVQVAEGVHANLINCLIIDNNSPNSSIGGISIKDSSSVSLYNTIVWNNRPNNITMLHPTTHLDAHYSLIENGAQTYIYPSWLLNDGNIEYGDSNLPAGSTPLFAGIGPYKYMPRASSCTIDTGTLDLPPGIVLPDIDLAGNPRVYGDGVDLGPYEWQGLDFDITFIQMDNQVSFIPLSNQEINDIHWDFDLDGIIDSNELAPTHIYQSNGTYSVGCYVNGGMAGRVIHDAIVIKGLQTAEDVTMPDLSIRCYPNPFNPETTISYFLPEGGHTNLSIYNIKGQRVRKIVDAELKHGQHQSTFNGLDDNGRMLPSGLYFARISQKGLESVLKIVLMK